MSDTPQASDWWQASDGKWYPPQSHPDYAARAGQVPAQQPGPLSPDTALYPVSFEIGPPQKIDNWRALVQLFMLIPHFFIMNVLSSVASVVGFISWFAILFTGKLPDGLGRFQVMVLRYNNRVMTYALLMHSQYPPFEFDTVAIDPGITPDRTSAVLALENRNRLTVFFRFFMVIPHAIVLAFLAIAAFFAFIIGWFAVLFTGRLPDGIAMFLIGFGRWSTRVGGYAYMLTDEYPPFSLG